MPRDPANIDEPGDRADGAQQGRAATTSARIPSQTGAATRARRLLRSLGQLALLDSWSPDGDRRRCQPRAWRDLLVEWTRSGDLTRSQAAALLSLDESTPWQV